MDERIRLILDMAGGAAVRAVEKDVDAFQAKLEGLVKDWQTQNITFEEFLRESGRGQADLNQTRGLLDQELIQNNFSI